MLRIALIHRRDVCPGAAAPCTVLPCLNQSTNLGSVAAYLARADHTDACDVIEFDHRLELEVRGEEQRE